MGEGFLGWQKFRRTAFLVLLSVFFLLCVEKAKSQQDVLTSFAPSQTMGEQADLPGAAARSIQIDRNAPKSSPNEQSTEEIQPERHLDLEKPELVLKPKGDGTLEAIDVDPNGPFSDVSQHQVFKKDALPKPRTKGETVDESPDLNSTENSAH